MSSRRRILLLLTAFLGVGIGLVVRSFLLTGPSRVDEVSDRRERNPGPHHSPLVRPRVSVDKDGSVHGTPDEGDDHIFFQVFDYSTKSLIEDLSVTLIRGGDESPVPVTKNAFEVVRGAAAGAVLRLASPGYFTLLTEINYVPPGERAFDLFLVPGTEILVRCIAEDTRRPIASAWVDLALDDHNRLRSRTDPDGMAQFTDLSLRSQLSPAPDEPYSLELIARAPDFVEKRELLHLHPYTDWTYVQLVLEPSRTIRGLVRDAATGLGIPHATVVAQWGYRIRRRVNSSEKEILCGSDGTFLLPVRRGATHIEVVAGHPAYASLGRVIEELPGSANEGVEAENGSDLILELEPGHDVCGTVFDERGAPVPGVELHLYPLSGKESNDWMRYAIYKFLDHFPDIGLTGEDGSFCLRRVPRGEYRVGLIHRGYFPAFENPTVLVGDESPASWSGVLVKGMEVRGEVFTAEGVGVPGATVGVSRRDSQGQAMRDFGLTTSTDWQGAFTLRGLAPTTYHASVSSTAGRIRGLTFHPLEVDVPWRIVLPPTKEEDHLELDGCLRLVFDVGHGFIVPNGLAYVDLYPLSAENRHHTFIEFIEAGEIYRDRLQPGVFRAVVRLTGYPPAIAEVDVGPTDREGCSSDPQYVVVPEGVPVLLDLSDSSEQTDDARIIWIRSSSGLGVQKVSSSFCDEQGNVLVVLAPGTYEAIPVADVDAGRPGTMFEVSAQVDEPIVVHLPSS